MIVKDSRREYRIRTDEENKQHEEDLRRSAMMTDEELELEFKTRLKGDPNIGVVQIFDHVVGIKDPRTL